MWAYFTKKCSRLVSHTTSSNVFPGWTTGRSCLDTSPPCPTKAPTPSFSFRAGEDRTCRLLLCTASLSALVHPGRARFDEEIVGLDIILLPQSAQSGADCWLAADLTTILHNIIHHLQSIYISGWSELGKDTKKYLYRISRLHTVILSTQYTMCIDKLKLKLTSQLFIAQSINVSFEDDQLVRQTRPAHWLCEEWRWWRSGWRSDRGGVRDRRSCQSKYEDFSLSQSQTGPLQVLQLWSILGAPHFLIWTGPVCFSLWRKIPGGDPAKVT